MSPRSSPSAPSMCRGTTTRTATTTTTTATGISNNARVGSGAMSAGMLLHIIFGTLTLCLSSLSFVVSTSSASASMSASATAPSAVSAAFVTAPLQQQQQQQQQPRASSLTTPFLDGTCNVHRGHGHGLGQHHDRRRRRRRSSGCNSNDEQQRERGRLHRLLHVLSSTNRREYDGVVDGDAIGEAILNGGNINGGKIRGGGGVASDAAAGAADGEAVVVATDKGVHDGEVAVAAEERDRSASLVIGDAFIVGVDDTSQEGGDGSVASIVLEVGGDGGGGLVSVGDDPSTIVAGGVNGENVDDTGLSSSDAVPAAASADTPTDLWAVEAVDRVSPLYPPSSSMDDEHTTTTPVINPLALKPNVPTSWFVGNREAVAARVEVTDDLYVTSRPSSTAPAAAAAFTLGGPRMELAYDPTKVRAAVVTCGGLCPGLNTVIREIAMCLRRQYGVTDVFGIRGGYRGLLDPTKWIELTHDYVSDIHNVGGSVLGTSRGGHDTNGIVDALERERIDTLFIVGGDGTVRGAMKVADEVKRRNLRTSIAVVPKTIDNDIPLVDRTFGFETAVQEARRAVDAVDVETSGFPRGLGIVKLMGRRSGFIAMHTALGSRVADLCLVPEVPFVLDGTGGIVDHLYDRLVEHDKAIVIVAEGAGQDNLASEREEIEKKNAGARGEGGKGGAVLTDLSGNVLLDDVGPWLCARLKERIDSKLKDEFGPDAGGVSLKYIDPSYMVRGVPANSADNVYCAQLAHNAVHGAMAGYTSFLVGLINTRLCYVPLRLVADKRNVLDAAHRSIWANVVFDTGQPGFEVDPEMCDVYGRTTASGGCVAKG